MVEQRQQVERMWLEKRLRAHVLKCKHEPKKVN